MPSSSLIVPEKPRTPPSPTWRWPPRPARLRPEPRRAASAWPSTISCSGSKKSSETRPSFQDPRYSDGRSRDQGTREPGNHANQGTGDPGARRNLSSRAKHTKPVSVAPFYVAMSGADIGLVSELFFDPEQLIVLGHALAARRGSGLNLAGRGGHRQ